ncbi:MAG: hypothetical protein P1P90_01335 [Patescibacteria group bacterium]|nr:hypothetical protein [Patescibacteria group bacterium]
MNSTQTAAASTSNPSSRTVRLAKEFIRLNTKFSKQNLHDHALTNAKVAENARKAVALNENRSFPNLEPITPEDVSCAVREMLAYERELRRGKIEEERKARLVECPACGIKRRDPRFEHCAVCARLDAENEALIKAGKLRPGTPLSLEEIDAIAVQQQTAATEELYVLWYRGQLPEGCEVLEINETQIHIQSRNPDVLWKIDFSELLPARSSEPSIESIDQGWDIEAVAA